MTRRIDNHTRLIPGVLYWYVMLMIHTFWGGGAGGRRSLVVRSLSVILTLQLKFLNRVRSYVDLKGLRSFRVCNRRDR